MCNFPKVRLGGAAGCNGGPSAAADILGKLPLGKLHIWEVAIWEKSFGKVPNIQGEVWGSPFAFVTLLKF